MKPEHLTCLACGVTGPGVRATLVAYPDPVPVTVMVPVSARENAVEVPRTVPGRYGAEWRCTDVRACLSRRPKLKPEPMDPVEPPTAVAPEPAEAGGEDWFR